ncbi:MAG: O-acetylhomoserine aminocarboxypropyltransferase/cysteine synthase [Candidatus Omnitrophica bacterium]|nr:O-acetylhomoserine aminocarboxypropyltransferase/cysteine synthase [Candidatus Omnitrophota bacterium]
MKFTTRVLSSRFLKDDPHGSLRMPVYDNAAFEFASAEELELAFLGKNPAHAYSRITNPTVEDLELRIKEGTGAIGVVALSSGMAAIANVIMTIASFGDNIVTTRHLFGNTYSLFENTLKAWGLETRYADFTDLAGVEKHLDGRTKAVFLETITNPQLEVADIRALSDIARERRVPVIADTTLTPPGLFRSGDFGIDIEVISSTKYISGGATSVGGLIIDNGKFDWRANSKLAPDAKKFGPFAFLSRLRREVYRNLGACMSPHSAYLQSLGLETLELRAGAASANAEKLALFLEGARGVKSVNYPGLKSSKYYVTAKEQFGGKFGSLLTFDLASKEECFKLMNGLKILRRATNIQDNRSLVIHPESTIFAEYPDAVKSSMGIRKTTVRISAGIEDADDLIADIKNALEAL